jgi:hypothetical protein
MNAPAELAETAPSPVRLRGRRDVDLQIYREDAGMRNPAFTAMTGGRNGHLVKNPQPIG